MQPTRERHTPCCPHLNYIRLCEFIQSLSEFHDGWAAIQEPLEAIVNAVRAVLVETPPELSSDIIDKGMVMTGGGSMLRRINELLTEVTGVPCYVADQPASCVAIGTGLALENLDILRDSLSGDELN